MARKLFIIETKDHPEGTNIWTKAVVVGDNLVPLLQADVSGYSLSVFDRDSDTSETEVYSFADTDATSVVYNTLQLGPEWTKNDTGYNFKHMVEWDAWVQQGGHTYVLEYELQTDDWGPVPIIHRVTVVSRHRI